MGGSDHALYSYELSTGRLLRKLYTKTSGHIDWCVPVIVVWVSGGWGRITYPDHPLACMLPATQQRRVSTVTHLSDGRVMSGGGDGKVCVWPTGRGTVCQDLDGHASAVSKVMAVPDSRLALSGGYDGKVRGGLGPVRCQVSCCPFG